jgi:hypothetical protein
VNGSSGEQNTRGARDHEAASRCKTHQEARHDTEEQHNRGFIVIHDGTPKIPPFHFALGLLIMQYWRKFLESGVTVNWPKTPYP